MNYYNPYYSIPTYMTTAPASRGLLGGIIGRGAGISWGSILNNVQRALGIANQAIPVIKQVTPVMKNARTMFQVMNEFKKVDTPTKNERTDANKTTNSSNSKTVSAEATDTNPYYRTTDSSAGPTFFV